MEKPSWESTRFLLNPFSILPRNRSVRRNLCAILAVSKTGRPTPRIGERLSRPTGWRLVLFEMETGRFDFPIFPSGPGLLSAWCPQPSHSSRPPSVWLHSGFTRTASRVRMSVFALCKGKELLSANIAWHRHDQYGSVLKAFPSTSARLEPRPKKPDKPPRANLSSQGLHPLCKLDCTKDGELFGPRVTRPSYSTRGCSGGRLCRLWLGSR